MRHVKVPLLACLVFLLLNSPVYSSWAYAFVVNDGRLFVVSDDVVQEELVEENVGEVKYYSTQEGSYSGNFSNIYPAGTKYYAIQGYSSEEVIAVQSQAGEYIKAYFEREYGSSQGSNQPEPEPYSEKVFEMGKKDYSMVLAVLLTAFVTLFITISAVVIKNRRI